MSDAHALNLLATAFASTLRSAEERRRTYIESAAEREVKQGVVHGFVDLTGAGEAVVTVSFPLVFMERPCFTAGFELADNHWLTSGNFPLWSASVGTWTIDTTPSGVKQYVGAQLGVIVFGPDGLRSILHYTFAGKSFSGPTNRDPSVGGVL